MLLKEEKEEIIKVFRLRKKLQLCVNVIVLSESENLENEVIVCGVFFVFFFRIVKLLWIIINIQNLLVLFVNKVC